METPGITPLMEVGKKGLRIQSRYIREAIGEFFGSMIVGFMCVGAGGQALVSPNESQMVPVLGICFGIMTAIMITGGVSGGHVNPSVTIAIAIAGGLSWYSLPGYIISQFAGALVGALLAWPLIEPSLRHKLNVPNDMSIPQFDMANDSQIAGIFSPLKSPGCTLFNGISTEVVLTCLLIMVICATLDKQNSVKPPAFLIPIMIPLVIAGFCFAHELPSGTLLNPARDMGPRLAAWIIGWKPEYVFMSKDYDGNLQHWWMVGLFGPIIGGILGALIYSFIIGPQMNLEHLQAQPVNMSQTLQNRSDVAIRQVLVAKSSDASSNDWRNTAFIPKAMSMHPPQQMPNVNQFHGGGAGYINNNNFLSSETYNQQQQQQRQQMQSTFQGPYHTTGYPKFNFDS